MFKLVKAYLSVRLLLVATLLVTGCGGGGGGTSADGGSQSDIPQSVPQVGTILLQQVLLRAVPSVVDQQRFTGYDASGASLYGPLVFPKSSTIELTGVPIAVTQLQIEFLSAGQVIGMASIPVTIDPNQPFTIVEPPFQDVEAVLSSLQILPISPTIADGTTQKFSATGIFTDSSQRDLTNSVTWSSEQPSVASISQAGVATALSTGSSQIRAVLGNISTSTTLTVSPAVITSIVVTPPTATIPDGTTQQFTATATLSNRTTQDVTNSVTWASSAPGVSIVDDNGLSTGVDPGQAEITATLAENIGTASLKVTTAQVTSIQITPPTPSIANGTTVQLTATASFSDGTTRDVTGTAAWTSSLPATVNVSPSGAAGGLQPGQVTLSAEFDGVIGQTTLTVTNAVITSVSVTPPIASIPDGTTQQFTATANFSDGSTQDVTASASWVSDTPSVAVVAPGGLATGVDPGQANITATFDGQNGQTTLTVTNAVITSVNVTPPAASIPDGTTQQFTATANFSDGSTRDVTASASWVSDTPSAAVVAPGGLATGVDPGQAVVTGTFNGRSGQATLTVTNAVIVTFFFQDGDRTLPQDLTLQFRLQAEFSDGGVVNVSPDLVSFQSTGTGSATVDSQGRLSANEEGEVTVSAFWPEHNATAEVRVTVTRPEFILAATIDLGLYGRAVSSGDIDKDGTADLAIGGITVNNSGPRYRGLEIVRNTSSGVAQQTVLESSFFSFDPPERIDRPNPVIADFPVPGERNILFDGNIHYNDGTGGFVSFEPLSVLNGNATSLPTTYKTIEQFFPGELDGVQHVGLCGLIGERLVELRNEVVGTGIGGSPAYRVIENGSIDTSQPDGITFTISGYSLLDLTGDGFLDVLAFQPLFPRALIYINNQNSNYTKLEQSNFLSKNLQVADFTNDGIPDIVDTPFVGSGPALVLKEGDGTGNFNQITGYGDWFTGTDFAVGNFDGDNRPDVVFPTSLGVRLIANQSPNGILGQRESSSLETQVSAKVTPLHWNTDGKLDIAVIKGTQLQIFVNNM